MSYLFGLVITNPVNDTTSRKMKARRMFSAASGPIKGGLRVKNPPTAPKRIVKAIRHISSLGMTSPPDKKIQFMFSGVNFMQRYLVIHRVDGDTSMKRMGY
jgi:hypothetical protein